MEVVFNWGVGGGLYVLVRLMVQPTWQSSVIERIGMLTAFPFENAERISDREIIEALTELKAGQKALNERIDDINKRIGDINKRIDDVSNSLNKRIDVVESSINKRIDDLKDEIKALRELSYVVIGGIFILIGFVIWDRRSAISPVIKRSRELLIPI